LNQAEGFPPLGSSPLPGSPQLPRINSAGEKSKEGHPLKTKSSGTNRSAFLNLRVLLGLFIVLAGLCLALVPFGVFSAAVAASTPQAHQKHKIIANSKNPLVPNGFDCSRIHELGIDKQLNFRAGAIMIACGQAEGGSPSPSGTLSRFIQSLLPAPLVYGTADVNIITGPETYPYITQSETFIATNPDNPNQIVVAYNDARGITANPLQFAGASVSTDGGNTFTRLTLANGQSPFAGGGANGGDPVVLYNRASATWHTIWLDAGCGGGSGLGIGGYKSTTPWDPTSWSHYCIHESNNDDRESGWSDNNPSSPFYGRMYVSWNNFNVNSGALFVLYSTDNGSTWSGLQQLSDTYYTDAQITGDLATGDVYIVAMDEMGGGLVNRANLVYRSTDGGNTWTNTYVSPAFPAPGRGAVGFYATMYNNPPYWRHFGFGEPAALNGVVHYVYAARNTSNGDPGDVFYIRSTDRGQTFSAPFQLNSDADHTKAQWAPNLSVTETGSLLAVWYDERERTTDCQPTGNPCYRMWARRSTDNGVTWLPDDAFSDLVSPLPLQPSPDIVSIYVGDYDNAIASPTQHLVAWADGRVSISGPQQDVFFDRQPLGLAVAGTDPCVGCIVFTQPTDFVVNVSDPVDQTTLQGADLTINGTPANTVSYTPGATTMTFTYTSTPVSNQGLQTMHIPAGAFTRASDGSPVLEFNGTFRYDASLLQVVSINPPVGGTFTPPGPGSYTYDVNFNDPVDPASVQTSDLILSGVPGTVTNVNVINDNMTVEFTLNLTGIFSGALTVSIAAGTITDQFGNPGAAFSGDYQYVAGNWCDSGIIQNGGFETGDLTGWVITGHNNDPVVTNTNPHSGTYSAAAGNFGPYPSPEPTGFSRFYQLFNVPAGQSTLSFWHWDYSTDPSADYQFAYIVDPFGSILHVIFARSGNGQTWINEQVDTTPWAEQTVRIAFGVEQDGFGDDTGMYVDDVALYEPCATPTPTPTSTPRATPTPRPRPTPAPRP
jgi:hypothetical protein